MKQAFKRMKNISVGKKGEASVCGKILALMTTVALLLAGEAFAAEGGEKASSGAGTVKPRVFNVLN